MEEVVFLDRETVRADFRPLSFDHVWTDYANTTPSEILERLHSATIAITNKVRLPGEIIRALPRLKLIAVAATGVDNIDVRACEASGIAVVNVREYASSSVAEHVFAGVLALRRNLLAYRDSVRRGEWQTAGHFSLFVHAIADLRDSVLGIVGYGSIGQATAQLARAFGMDVQIAERRNQERIRPGRLSFDELLKTSDILSLHLPLEPETTNIIGRAELLRMKPSAVLVNTARGGLVDAAALAETLRQGRLGGAFIDVLPEEPPTRGNPLLDLQLPNLLVTPHVAWASAHAMQRLADQVIANIEAFIAGHPNNLVSRFDR